MKTDVAIVPVRRFDTACWSALRFTGRCDECRRFAPKRSLQKCELPEARKLRAERETVFGTQGKI